VPLLGELAERALDLGVGRAALDAEDLVVVAFGGGHGFEGYGRSAADGVRLPSTRWPIRSA
jgi:hypothetical protein